MTHPAISNIYQTASVSSAHPAPGEEQIETLLASGAIRLERIASHGQPSPEGFWYDQPTPEWVILLQGAATLQFADNWTMDLKAGDYLLIPAHLRHRVAHTSEDALWLAVHAG